MYLQFLSLLHTDMTKVIKIQSDLTKNENLPARKRTRQINLQAKYRYTPGHIKIRGGW